MFWRIHGWIEAKWKQFEAVHVRTPARDDELRPAARALPAPHAAALGLLDDVARGQPPVKALVQQVKGIIFSNEPDCTKLADGTQTDNCP